MKTSTKLVYLLESFVGALSIFKKAVMAFLEEYILLPMLKLILRVAIYTIKTSYSKSKIATTN